MADFNGGCKNSNFILVQLRKYLRYCVKILRVNFSIHIIYTIGEKTKMKIWSQYFKFFVTFTGILRIWLIIMYTTQQSVFCCVVFVRVLSQYGRAIPLQLQLKGMEEPSLSHGLGCPEYKVAIHDNRRL